MKNQLFILVLLVSSFHTKAQYPYHRAITLKSNFLAWVNIALEVPVYKRLTSEISFRDIAYNFPGENHKKRSVRGHIKYHFPQSDELGKYYSFYLFAGINNFKHSALLANNEKGALEVTRAVLGIGSKRRRIDIWIAIEPVMETQQNIYYMHRASKRWENNYSISGGIALNLINIKL